MRSLELAGVEKVNSGKVREIFAVGSDKLLIVATDRISAFDVILPDAVPDKGKILTQMSAFWFEQTRKIVNNHLISIDVGSFPEPLPDYVNQLKGRSTLATRCEPLAIECVVRGYLTGSGWKDYCSTGSVCGISLPEGMVESEKLSELIFTPATKAQSGHDENISFERAAEIVGQDIADRVRTISLDLYSWAAEYALERGIIICDTKFEFGLQGNDLILIDEILTPDSSRFWPAQEYVAGRPQPSFDKQFVRNYLETLDWDKRTPGPRIPEDVLRATADRYMHAYRLLTGTEPNL
jgi:phosphoribosylaminoimidazole-succinocarboxamide synthase